MIRKAALLQVLAGVLAIGFRSIGFVGKLLAEALEETPRGPIEALQATGAPPTSILSKGYWPFVEPSFWGIALFRWDINIRESAVLGLVGGGGIGVSLDAAMSNLYWDQVGLILLVIFLVVVAAVALEKIDEPVRRGVVILARLLAHLLAHALGEEIARRPLGQELLDEPGRLRLAIAQDRLA